MMKSAAACLLGVLIAGPLSIPALQKQAHTYYGCGRNKEVLDSYSAGKRQNSFTQIDSCGGAKAGIEMATVLAKTTAFRTAVQALHEKAALSPAQEQIVAFGKDSSGNVILSSVATGGKSSAGVPVVLNAFADLHNHPKSTPPSSGDLYGLIQKNKKDSSYRLRFVITPDAQLYALFVADAAAAALFVLRFPSQQVAGYSPLFPDELFTEFRSLKDQHGATDEAAMAYMLEKYNTGIFLLKQGSTGDFKTVTAIVSGTGNELIITAGYCP